MAKGNYVIRVLNSPLELSAAEWNSLLAAQDSEEALNPFMRYEYLVAMHESGSATPRTGWTPRVFNLFDGEELVAGCVLYLKAHSYGEYVFDWAWANAYQQHGLPYYPKAVIASPFTPVPGARLLAKSEEARAQLVQALITWCEDEGLSSLHMLFAGDEDVAACSQAGLMLRHTVQFHWTNGQTAAQQQAGVDAESQPPRAMTFPALRPFVDFEDFLKSLSQEKRKKIRQERRKVAEAGVTFRWALGEQISAADWDFFYRCYERTYYEHGNAPYLSRDFFRRMADTMPENWLLFTAQRDGQPIGVSLIALNSLPGFAGQESHDRQAPVKVAYGRYWGALERVDCLHFEACYYQPLQWCIEQGYQRFEGGAQGEHKMARALLPVKTTSAHWLAHPAFAEAVERFLEREGEGISNYMEDLERRNPLKKLSNPA